MGRIRRLMPFLFFQQPPAPRLRRGKELELLTVRGPTPAAPEQVVFDLLGEQTERLKVSFGRIRDVVAVAA